ncbi:hypothetical protein LSM04_005027 [Trypanosoma melophagium]|uniref:uncharacterized protein n=1 Tax=Trypanosoma melophagium TaxID=715481 RepID=UPI003519E105|nr:hypothetical protein LSM04_005027 [Trypanosoma melophagium]
MGERVESVFDQLQTILDNERFGLWNEDDVTTLLSLLTAYHKHQQKRQKKCDCKGKKEEEDETYMDDEDIINEVDRSLTKLRRFLQKRLPYGSINEPNAPPQSQTSLISNEGNNVEKDKNKIKAPVYPIDAFMYLEEDVDELVNQGCISREYCKMCGSVDIGLSDFITHSFSQDQLVYLSCYLLPALSDTAYVVTTDWVLRRRSEETPKEEVLSSTLLTSSSSSELLLTPTPSYNCRHIVDVGSRLGVVLLSCYFAAQQKMLRNTERVTGIELDKDMVTLQYDVIKRLASKPTSLRLNVIHSNCFEGTGLEVLRNADVLILHNVFEYFSASPQEHLQSWRRLRENVTRRGQLLICSPSLQETLAGFTEEEVSEVLMNHNNNNNNNNNNSGEGIDQSHVSHNSRKRSRDEIESESCIEIWRKAWVEEIDVTEVRNAFLARRHVDDTHRCNDQCLSDGEDEEFLERLQSLRVYVVK